MKSPQGLIWNTPSRRKPFRRDFLEVSGSDLERFFQEWDAVEERLSGSQGSAPAPQLQLIQNQGFIPPLRTPRGGKPWLGGVQAAIASNPSE